MEGCFWSELITGKRKKGEMLSGFKKDFVYEEKYLKGAEFNVYAAENIYTPDYQKDENGNRQLIYAKDALVTTVTTGEDGKAVADNLPLGSYYVVEKTAPEGFVLNHDRSDVAFVYADQDTPVIEQEVTVGDDRQKVAIVSRVSNKKGKQIEYIISKGKVDNHFWVRNVANEEEINI